MVQLVPSSDINTTDRLGGCMSPQTGAALTVFIPKTQDEDESTTLTTALLLL